VLESVADEADSVEAKVAERREIERMLTLLDKLPALQREAVLLRYVEGLSLAELAEVMDTPVGTIKSRISVGLSRLRTLMQENGEL
jgi:RNA polymerase sigma-70 factor (ECF subfamily)